MKPFVLWVPLAIFVIFLLTVASGLYSPSDRKIPSRLVGKPMPEFALPAALPDKPGLAPADFKGGEPRILNVFASWCVPCIAEAPQLLALARRGMAAADTPAPRYEHHSTKLGLKVDVRNIGGVLSLLDEAT